MAIVVLPDAQQDLLALQEYMLSHWSESDWFNAENEIFEKLALVDSGLLTGAPVPELTAIGNFEYTHVFTSHHKLVLRRINDNIFVYAVAGHRQDYPALLMRRLLKI